MVDQLTPYEKSYLQDISERTSKGLQAVSTYLQTFSATTTLGTPNLLFTSSTSGSGSVTAPTANSPWVGLTVTTASGDEVIYQTKYYMRYWSYRTHRISFASSFVTATANQVQEAGIFDANDGFFFRYSTAGLQVVHRTATSGSPVDTVVSMADFNMDQLDGNGPSGLRAGLDFHLDRGVTLGIQYNWYGTQGAKFYLAYGNSVVDLHEFVFTGQVSGLPYMRTASLPLRFRIENTDTAASGGTMRVGTVSQAVADSQEGDAYYRFAASNGTTVVTVDSTTTWQDVLAVRPKTTVNSIANRGLIELSSWQLLANDNSIEYRIIDNVTYTGGSWTSAGADSIAEYSASPGTQAGTPRVLEVGYVYAGRNDGAQANAEATQSNIKVGLDTITGAQYCFVLQARKVSATTATALASIRWQEEL